MRATGAGSPALRPIDDCYIIIPSGTSQIKITARILPEVSDTKAAHYNDEPVMGRSFPIKTFSHGDNRTITVTWHFVTLQSNDSLNNLLQLRAIQSACYPRNMAQNITFLPPPICKIKVGQVLSNQELCVVMRQYSTSLPTDVAWETVTLLPYKFDVNMTFDVVFSSSDLPGQERIIFDNPLRNAFIGVGNA